MTPACPDLPGLDPAWSRTLTVPSADGEHTWHCLDNGAPPDRGTLLCVHGNPTWSYLWRRFLAAAPAGWRVVAPDQLGMGYSERTAPRTLAERIADLGDFTRAAGIDGPVALAVHDWGGAIGLGWALEHRDQLRALLLTNTAVWQPQDQALPAALRLITHPAAHRLATVATPAFVRGTTAVSRPRPARAVRDAFAAPYRAASDRAAVGHFVADIPAWPGHPSHETLRAVAEGVRELDVPALALWGPRDPVFTDRYLRDLRERLPQLDVHRFEGASHLVAEDRPECAGIAWRWLGATLPAPGSPSCPAAPPSPTGCGVGNGLQHVGDTTTRWSRGAMAWEPLLRVGQDRVGADAAGSGPRSTDRSAAPLASLDPAGPGAASTTFPASLHPAGPGAANTVDPDAIAIREMSGASITFGALRDRIVALARGMVDAGVTPGTRIGALIPPGIELTVAVYATWLAGGVVVVADAGLGYGKLARCLKSAHVDAVMGIPPAVALVDALRVPGRRFVTRPSPLSRRALSLTDLEAAGAISATLLPPGDPEADCAVLFTSGATGPSKGVVYTNAQISAQVETLRETFAFGPQERFVAAFAPFALYGPALLMPSVVPDIDVTRPDTLTAAKLADAVDAIGATLVFAAPAALRTVVASAGELTAAQREALARPRLVLSAGAPMPASLLRQVKQVLTRAQTHTPYGMTEALPVTDLDPTAVTVSGHGVCVGRPVPGVRVAVAALDDVGRPAAELTETPDVLGEIAVSGAHVKDRYLHLWATQADSARNPGWHRTGDIGHLDAEGNLWVEGRLQHVVSTPAGPVAPVAVEHAVQVLPHVAAAACVGVGPVGTQAVVVVVQPGPGVRVRQPLAPASLTRLVREAVDVPVAAVLLHPGLPTDIRHRSKVDRAALAVWADAVLRGVDAPGSRLMRWMRR